MSLTLKFASQNFSVKKMRTILLISLICFSFIEADNNSEDEQRQSKLLPIFQVVRFPVSIKGLLQKMY